MTAVLCVKAAERGVETPSKAIRSPTSAAGWLSRMSKALPKGGSALCFAEVSNIRLWPSPHR